MARHKDFGGGTDITDFEPLTFTIMNEEFSARPAIQGRVLLTFVAQASGNDGGAAAAALDNFFASCMEPDEYERFRTFLDNPSVIIDMEKIGEIASWLVEEYSERPTKRPAPSANGQPTSGLTSADARSSAV